MVNQSKLHLYHTSIHYKYGYEVPKSYADVIRPDEEAGNKKWQESTVRKMEQLDEYSTFTDHGKDGEPPKGFKKIWTHLIFDCKHDGRYKSKLIADGHPTPIPIESVYSSVVSLHGLHLVVFLTELNNPNTWATDIGNAHLEPKILEHVYIIAGPEFGEREGHTLIIFKALCVLRTSGPHWHE